MKIYVSDIGDSSVGIQELTVATLDIHESMVEVLEDENEMENFKKEFMALIDKYCQPEVSYDVYSDKDLEEEAKAEDILSRPGCTDGAISSRGFGKIEETSGIPECPAITIGNSELKE